MSSTMTKFMVCMGLCAIFACASGRATAQSDIPPIQMAPTFEDPLAFQVNVRSPYGLAAADFLDATGQPGQDGLPEIAVAGAGTSIVLGLCDEQPINTPLLKIYRNKGTWDTNPAGALVEHQAIFLDNDLVTTELAFADVNASGDPDLVLLAYDPILGDGFLWVFQNLGNGYFDTDPFEFPVSGFTLRGLEVVDLDGDGDLDVAAAASMCGNSAGARDYFIVFRNDTDPFDKVPTFATPLAVHLSIPNDTAPGDIVASPFYGSLTPGQSLPDLVTPNPAIAAYSKIQNLDDLQFHPTSVGVDQGCNPADWTFITATAARFGSDSWWDFAAVEPGMDIGDDGPFKQPFLGVFKGDGLGEFTSYCDDSALRYVLYPNDDQTIVRAHGVTSGNLNGGPGVDLAVALHYVAGVANPEETPPSWASAVGVLLGRSDGSFQINPNDFAYIYPLENYEPGESGAAAMVVLTDLNGDGFDDIVVSGNSADPFAGDFIFVLINKMQVVVSQP
jgi:hypothetical protein